MNRNNFSEPPVRDMRAIILPILTVMVTAAIGVAPAASQPEQDPQFKEAYELLHRMDKMFATNADINKGETLRLLLLRNINNNYIQDFLGALHESPQVTHDDQGNQFYSYPQSGLSITTKNQGDIRAFFFSADNQYGYHHYRGV